LPNHEVPVYFTIQPGGASLLGLDLASAQGARLIYPNFSGSLAGTRIDFWNYDSRDKGWYIYGKGTVSTNGKQVIPDPGVVIYGFTGAMVALAGHEPTVNPTQGGCPEPRGGDPVDCFTGLFLEEHTDLEVGGIMPISLTRSYRPLDTASHAFGIGTNFSYDFFMVGDRFPYTYQDLILPDGGRIHFTRVSPGTGLNDAVYVHNQTPTRFQGARLEFAGGGPGIWKITLKNGTVYWFPESSGAVTPQGSAVVGIVDRNGNTLTLTRDANHNLTNIVAPNGHWIALTYDSSNRITQATDNSGRKVSYTYDTSGRLASVTNAAGAVTRYTYDASHRMLTVTDPRLNKKVTNLYDTNGRVIK
jgi:YD repeat-containing protein